METKIITNHSKPEILISTPLLPGDKISRITKKTIKRNSVPFSWVSTEANQNIPMNHLESISWFKNKFNKLPPYIFFLDRDIEAGRGLLDRLYNKLQDTPLNIGFSYATFQFKGHVNRDFPAKAYDINKLVQSNYISSNSLFKSSVIEHVGLVTDDKYKRLLDWAFLLKCFSHGYIGLPEPKA